MADQITIHDKTKIVNNPITEEISLQKNRNILVNNTLLPQSPRRVTNITLNYTPPKLRTILISELIYAYKDCESSLFRVPNWESKSNAIVNFRWCMRLLGMTEDMDTRYLGGRHPKSGLTLIKHLLNITEPHEACRIKTAKSLFSKSMVEYYESVGIETSYFSNWTSCQIRSQQPKAFVPTTEINTVIQKCEAEKHNRTHFYKGFLLCYGLGLRNAEMRRAKWDDLYEDLDGNKIIRIWNPKSGGEYQDRPCDPYYWDKVMEMRDFSEKIIDVNTHTMRNKFPRFLMNECNLGNRAVHLLRKYCGHRLMRSNGIYAASKALGHTNLSITDKVYSGLPTLKATKIA